MRGKLLDEEQKKKYDYVRTVLTVVLRKACRGGDAA